MPVDCPGFIASHYPELCRAVDHYCERTGPAFDAEPVNAISNAAFLVSSAAAWRLSQRHAPPRAAEGLTQVLIAMIAVIGLGSFLFHTIGNRWTEWADVLPILLFMLLYLWLVLTLFFASPVRLKTAAVSLLAAATLAAEAFAPPAFLWGGALYLPAALTIVAFSSRRPEPRQGRGTRPRCRNRRLFPVLYSPHIGHAALRRLALGHSLPVAPTERRASLSAGARGDCPRAQAKQAGACR